MAKRRDIKEEQKMFYNIKTPVFTTRILDEKHGLFPDIRVSEMVDMLMDKVKNFNEIQTGNRNKTFINVIDSVLPKRVLIGETPALLLKIPAYKTHIYGGYFQSHEKIQIQKESRLGDDSNYVLLYPKISGISPQTYSCYFLMLAYEDPNKEAGQVSKLAKEIAKQV